MLLSIEFLYRKCCYRHIKCCYRYHFLYKILLLINFSIKIAIIDQLFYKIWKYLSTFTKKCRLNCLWKFGYRSTFLWKILLFIHFSIEKAVVD